MHQTVRASGDRLYQPAATMSFDTAMYERAAAATRAVGQQKNSIQIVDDFRQTFVSGIWVQGITAAYERPQSSSSSVGRSVRNCVGGAVMFWLITSPSAHATLTTTVNQNEGALMSPAKMSEELTPWEALDSKLMAWKTLPDDWDGEDGVAPSEGMVAAARNFLIAVRGIGLSAPTPFIAGDGEIGFRWERGGCCASADFLPDGHIVAFSRTVPDQAPIAIDQPYELGIDLSAFLASVKGFV